MLELFAHPFSSYCQKALIALYENDTPFIYRSPADPAENRVLRTLWPFGKFPVLIDADATIAETSVIVEHLDLHHRGPVRLLPDDPVAALDVRFMDRVFDNHVMGQAQRFVDDALLPPERRNPAIVAKGAAALDIAYDWLDMRMAGREWASGGFSLADCAAAPSLFYADWVHPIAPEHRHLRAYRARLIDRPSFARCIAEARPFRNLFPLGAPDRD